MRKTTKALLLGLALLVVIVGPAPTAQAAESVGEASDGGGAAVAADDGGTNPCRPSCITTHE